MIERKLMAVTAVLVTAMALLALPARGEGLGVGVDLTYAQRYIWRGMPLNEDAVLQPSIDLSKGGFDLNAWGNMDTTDWGEDHGYGDKSGDFSEIDYTASYTGAVGPLSLTAGFVNYTFPNIEVLGPTTEVFFGAGLDVLLQPSITTYIDEGNAGPNGTVGANYTSLDIGHSFSLVEDKLSLDFGAHLGYANHKFLKAYYGINEESDFHDWSAAVSLPITLPAGFYLTPSYQYSQLLEDESKETVDKDWELDTSAGIFLVSFGWSGELPEE